MHICTPTQLHAVHSSYMLLTTVTLQVLAPNISVESKELAVIHGIHHVHTMHDQCRSKRRARGLAGVSVTRQRGSRGVARGFAVRLVRLTYGSAWCGFLMPSRRRPARRNPDYVQKRAFGGGLEMFDYLAVTYLGRGRRARAIWRGGYKGIPWCGCGIGPTPWRPPVSLQAPCAGVGRGVSQAPCAGVGAGCRNT